jgi:hypothetical protein
VGEGVRHGVHGYDAELSGSSEIDLALAWLVARAHYSSALLPDGQLRHYERERGRSLATRRDVVPSISAWRWPGRGQP